MTFTWSSLRDYSTVIDVRSPAEFKQDHIPGSINLPVLDDDQRAAVGTLYKEDPFRARREGMGIVATNLAAMASGELADKDPDWRPLVYCWRGGMRSGSVVKTMCDVGWQATALSGGYRSYRQQVRADLVVVPATLRWYVLCGPTGSGKTLLLQELRQHGAQVIDLEGLANHRGSLFGSLGEQPSQKMFESLLAQALAELNPAQPVFVESESSAIGSLRVPRELLAAMHVSPPVLLEADLQSRARLTVRDYTSKVSAVEFAKITQRLARYIGNAQVEQWRKLFAQEQLKELAASLLEQHYDRTYLRSLGKHYDLAAAELRFSYLADDPAALTKVAAQLSKQVASTDAALLK